MENYKCMVTDLVLFQGRKLRVCGVCVCVVCGQLDPIVEVKSELGLPFD